MLHRTARVSTVLAIGALACAAHAERQSDSGPVPVRHAEGILHGFLTLSTADGVPLASGDLLQVPHEKSVESRMIFHFADSSYFEDKLESWEDTLHLPADVSNGLPIILLKNLEPGESRTVHLVAFTPEPRLIGLELSPVAEQHVLNGQRKEAMVEYKLEPQLGALTSLFARLLGKMPPDSHVWIVTEGVPKFVRFEGPLYLGPVWRIDLAAPKWGE